MECLGSCLTNKYSEGLPGKRYYGGNEFIDQIEVLCPNRALSAYGLDPEKWAVNVQPYSGSPANFAVYTGLLNPHDRIMGLDLPSGGHLTHGFYTVNKKTNEKKKISATSVFFESLPYRVDEVTGLIDYDRLEANADLFKPALIVCGGSAYPREWDYARLRAIADANGALLMMDMAHISGLVATKNAANPFEYCDVVTTTTHKSLRGPRAGMIFCRKDDRGFPDKINFAVFPGLQGGPHNHQIGALATQLKFVQTPAFDTYVKQVILNAQQLAKTLGEFGYKMCTGGTDNHLILWDLRPTGVTGSKVELVCENASISLNKNAVQGDKSALTPGGVRCGTPALTSRGLKEADFHQVGVFLHRAVQLALKHQDKVGKKLKDWTPSIMADPELATLRDEVRAFAASFPMFGLDTSDLTLPAAGEA